MRKIWHGVMVFLILYMFMACGSKEEKVSSIPETPKALESNGISDVEVFSSRKVKVNLVEELYSELVSKTPELKQLEKDLDSIEDTGRKINLLFSQFESKSVEYYTDAESLGSHIADSLLKKRMLEMIYQSKQGYENSTSDVSNMLKQFSQNSISLNDYHILLKVALTLPLIETYQKSNLPNKQSFKEVIEAQHRLIKTMEGKVGK